MSTDTVKKKQLVNFISDEDVPPSEPFDTPAVHQCVRNTWRVTLKPNESSDPLQGYVDGFKVAHPHPI
ncbi:hypothetical protein N7478_010643 [Penicillium angulare]|uniref:uncharacterized protein n=1 Tax=Penicillium angulare TaxID=116970 RepID=UPI002541AE37|nr:uncharacterized protein N7478_010643 [Penicillium angulare]KAJ5267835.1 hypothetical protein N7478_010643 [Penicillium angulare]